MGSLLSSLIPYGDLISTGAGLLGSLFGASKQSQNVRDTNAMNLQIARENNQLQQQIAQQNNQMQVAMNRENNEFNKQMAIDMFNRENAYNSPANQVALMLEGGVNPANMYGGAGVQAMSNATTPSAATSGVSPSMPSMVSPTMQTPPSVLGTLFTNFESLTRSMSNVAKSNLDKVQKQSLSSQLEQFIEKNRLEIQNQEIMNEWNGFKMNIDKLNLPRKVDAEISQIMSNVFKSYAEGGAAHASIALREAETRLTNVNAKSISEQLPYLIENLKKLGSLYDEEAETERTKQDVNKYQADYYRISSKDTEVAMLKKIEDSISLYLDGSDIKVDEEKLKEVKDNALKMAKNITRQQGADYWNPFNYVGKALSGSANLKLK